MAGFTPTNDELRIELHVSIISVCLYKSQLTGILSTGNKPTLPKLLKFPGRSGNINIPEKIGTNFRVFGIHLLNDENGERVESIARENSDVSLTILSRWLRGEGMQPATWRKLIQVLRDSNLSALAEDIENADL